MTATSLQPANLSPEAQLILACVRTARSVEEDERICTLVGTQLDWSFVVQQCEQHRVTPLVYSSLTSAAHCSIPDGPLLELRKSSVTTMQVNLFRVVELHRLLKRLQREEIGVIPYKGPVLAMQAYGNVALRQFVDLDLLIHRRDFVRARQVLLSEGYQPLLHHSLAQEKRYLWRSHDYPMLQQERQIAIELQWAITSRSLWFPLAYEQLSQHLMSVRLAGTEVRTIGIEQLLLVLCVHGSKHAWDRLIWICDVAQLVRGYPTIDWQWLVKYAERLGGRRMLSLGLLLAQELLQIELPVWISEWLTLEKHVSVLAAHVMDRLFLVGADRQHILGNQRLYNLWLMERLTDRLRLGAYYLRYTQRPLIAIRTAGFEALKRLIDF